MVVLDPVRAERQGAVPGRRARNADELAGILERRGALVTLTRATPDSALGLYPRTDVAIAAGGELFVSIGDDTLTGSVEMLRLP